MSQALQIGRLTVRFGRNRTLRDGAQETGLAKPNFKCGDTYIHPIAVPERDRHEGAGVAASVSIGGIEPDRNRE